MGGTNRRSASQARPVSEPEYGQEVAVSVFLCSPSPVGLDSVARGVCGVCMATASFRSMMMCYANSCARRHWLCSCAHLPVHSLF